MTIRAFLVDDHPLFLTGVRVALQDAGVAVAGEAHSGEEALKQLRATGARIDVVLVDVQLPGCSGIEVARAITSGGAPEGHRPRVLMVSMSQDDDVVVAALRAGAHGYTLKSAPREELLRAVRIVADGGAVFSPSVAGRLATYVSMGRDLPGRAAFPELTDRQRQILDLLARGYDNRRIARELVLSEKTVRNHLSHVFTRLRVNDRTLAAVRARDAGLGT
ncbi:response regulator transcription factor [Streptomyces sp. MST-110588]|uniref:response regulator n=1 Tax=Streptomyces sp. MST-110588 TaxID=2833628 RepID=UPI001F5CB53E|nr:response regulator transcription factor [Streptomyces sp. MST-110588]UNO43080.1 response regulator transcription factor [Streptomyces sp. MST-110588]